MNFNNTNNSIVQMPLNNGNNNNNIPSPMPLNVIFYESTTAVNVNPEPEQARKIFLGGLTSETHENDLISFYSKWGKIEKCSVWRIDGASRRFAFIVYSTIAESEAALLSARPHRICGKNVDAKRAFSPVSPKRKSLPNPLPYVNGFTNNNKPSTVISQQQQRVPLARIENIQTNLLPESIPLAYQASNWLKNLSNSSSPINSSSSPTTTNTTSEFSSTNTTITNNTTNTNRGAEISFTKNEWPKLSMESTTTITNNENLATTIIENNSDVADNEPFFETLLRNFTQTFKSHGEFYKLF